MFHLGCGKYGKGAKRRCITKEDDLFYIPILKTLQCLLNNETVLLEVFISYIFYCIHAKNCVDIGGKAN